MKKSIITFLVAFAIAPAFSQDLLDMYKSGSVKLVADPEYGTNNDWDVVFKSYYDTIYNTPMGNRKSLKLLPDGAVVVNHQYRDFYSFFSPNGTFKKEFSIKTKPGGVPQKHTYKIAGVLNGNIFFSDLDNLGNMLCFDFDGNYKKKLKLDYMTKQLIPLPNNKIAVVGWVIWSKKIREFVSIIDYNSNEQHDIWERLANRDYPENPQAERPLFHYSYKFTSGGMMGFCSMPFADRPGFGPTPQIASIGNKLMIAIPSTGEILIYDLEGNLITKDQIEWSTNYISIDEQKEIQQKAIDKYKDPNYQRHTRYTTSAKQRAKYEADVQDAIKEIIPQMEADLEEINKPIPKPMFSTLIKDSDENILFFEYPKEEGQNKFNVWIYKENGSFVCQSSFQCDEYDLQINPSKMVFHDGYIYSLQLLKNASGVPLRLVRFRLEGNN